MLRCDCYVSVTALGLRPWCAADTCSYVAGTHQMTSSGTVLYAKYRCDGDELVTEGCVTTTAATAKRLGWQELHRLDLHNNVPRLQNMQLSKLQRICRR